jgi:hypothetical protein
VTITSVCSDEALTAPVINNMSYYINYPQTPPSLTPHPKQMTASMQNINLFTDRNNQFCGDITYTLTGPLNKWTTASCIETALSPVITDTEACLAITGVALTSSSTACEAVQKANGGGQACSYKPS